MICVCGCTRAVLYVRSSQAVDVGGCVGLGVFVGARVCASVCVRVCASARVPVCARARLRMCPHVWVCRARARVCVCVCVCVCVILNFLNRHATIFLPAMMSIKHVYALMTASVTAAA